MSLTPLEKSLILSYMHCKHLIKNLDVSVHEMKVAKRADAGKLQFNLEQLVNKSRKAFSILEKNIPDMRGMEEEIEELLNQHWDTL